MKRGTFANIRLENRLVPGHQGPWTKHMPSGEIMRVDAAADNYNSDGRATVVIAGKNYGAGSARDWAAKGTRLLGMRAVLAMSFERIHCSNLIFLGVAPIELDEDLSSDMDWGSIRVCEVDVTLEKPVRPNARVSIRLRADGHERLVTGRLRADNATELTYLNAGGILPFVSRQLMFEDSSRA